METLTLEQQLYVEQWNNNKFNVVLSKIENKDLKKIAPFVNMRGDYTWWDDGDCGYSCILLHIRNEDQLKILLDADKEGKLEVSRDHNKNLEKAIINNDKEMISIIVSHKRFNYDGTGYFNPKYWYRNNFIMTSDLVKNEKFLELLDPIKYLYDLLNENDKPKLVADIFTAIKNHSKYQYVSECLKVFTSIK